MPEQGPIPTALIVGNGPQSAQAALDLVRAGAGVTLLTADEWLTPGEAGLLAIPTLLEATRHPRVRLLTGSTVQALHNGESGLRLTVHQSPRYVDPARCTACGACAEICPVTLFDVGAHPGGRPFPHKAIYRGGVPTTYAIHKAGMAPCRDACPIDQRAQGYVALIRAGNFQAAYRAIKRENPFPSVCGRVCNHRCEENCTRCQVDEPVAVMALKRFVTDWAIERGIRLQVTPRPATGRRVAIVGAGPAGLTAARELNRQGHTVTVFEALPVPGGMMRVGIPAFRLPRDRLQWDVDDILAEGVDLRLNTRVEDVEGLFHDGYDAVILAVGQHVSRRLDIPGIEGEGVLGAVEFLRRVNLDERPDWRGKRVIVVGGGSTAMDTARFCRRLGADVTVVYRRSRAEMPAHDFEVDDAQREGVHLHLLTNPARVIRDGTGRVTAVECLQMQLGEPDESGRRRPIPIQGSEFTLPADALILAIGQTSDLSLLPADTAHQRGIVAHDPATLMTDRPGLFVAGDVAGSGGFVVDAIAQGLRVARSVDRYLRGERTVPEPVRAPAVHLEKAQITARLQTAAPPGTSRHQPHTRPLADLLGNFDETEPGLTEAQAIAEAARCLSCGLCSECLACVEVCPAGAIDHDKTDRVFELSADVVIASPEFGGASLPALFQVDQKGGWSQAVDRALAHLGLSRAAPRVTIAAPSRHTLLTSHLAALNPQLAIFLCRCGGEIERTVDLSAVAARVSELPGAAHVSFLDFACHPEGAEAIRVAMSEGGVDGAVLAACSCCALDQICYSCTTQRVRCKERLGVWDGLDGLALQFVNLREQCAFVHADDPAAATRKAGDLVAAGLAALMTAGARPLAADGRLPIAAVVDLVRCRGCEDCELACGLDAIHVVGENGALRQAQVDLSRCMGCGVCMAVCSSGAILAGDTGDAQAEAMLAAMGDLGDKTLVLTCNWGAYSAIEAAGVSRLSYDPSVRVLRLMCAGRVHPGLILRAFAQGVERVLVLACESANQRVSESASERIGESANQRVSESANQRVGESANQRVGELGCRYHTGSERAAQAVAQTQAMLALLGIEPARLALAEMRPGDANHFISQLTPRNT